MERKSLLALSGATAAVALIAFQIGRQTAPLTDADSRNGTVERGNAAFSSHSLVKMEETDLSNVRIENIGQVSFDQAYDLLRSAPSEALARWATQLEALPTGPGKTAAITSFFRVLAQVDTKVAVDLALDSRSRPTRWAALSAIQGAAPASGFPEVARLLVGLKASGFTVIDFIIDWSNSDPVNAGRFAAAYPAGVNSNALSILLNEWAAVDPLAAKAWLDQLDPSRQKSDVYEGFFKGWLEHDRNAAVGYLTVHGTDKKLRKAIRSTALNLFGESSNAARAFVVDLPAGPAKEAAVDEIEAYATNRVFGSDVHFSADAVAKWLLTLPEEIWEGHIGGVVSTWSSEDQHAVDGWMNGMPSHVHDQVAAKFCLARDWDKPQSAIEAGFQIRDPRLREATLREFVRGFESKERAEELLQKVQLPKRERAVLKRMVADL